MFPFASLNESRTRETHRSILIWAAVTSRTPHWQKRAQRKSFKLYGLPLHSLASEAGGGQVWVRWTDPKRAVCASLRQNERGVLNVT